MRDFKALKVWQSSQDLTVQIYKITQTFPRDEQFGVTSQIRRASVSISSNIAEGCGRVSQAEFARFLEIAFGSACEVESLLLLCRRLGYLPEEQLKFVVPPTYELKRSLNSFIQKVKRESTPSQ